MSAPLVLVSHTLGPYVQRAAIVLDEKGLTFERRDIDLAHKPAWFLVASPLGKTPVLLVDAAPIFESTVICEHLENTALPRLHPSDAVQRAQHRGWMELGSALLNAIGAFYTAPDEAALHARAADIHARFTQVEAELGDVPYFAGSAFGMVDAAFAPAFRYFDTFDRTGDFGFWNDVPKVQRWREALAAPAVGGRGGVAGLWRAAAKLPARPRLCAVAAHRRRDRGGGSGERMIEPGAGTRPRHAGRRPPRAAAASVSWPAWPA